MNRKLKQKLEFIFEDNSIGKAELMEIIYMALEEGMTLQDAILDTYIPEIDDEYDLDDDLDRNDFAYDSWKDEQVMKSMEE